MRSPRTALALAGASLLVLSACAETTDTRSSTEGGSGADATLSVGTTDQVTGLDPAGTWDLGSAALHGQVYRWLMTSEPGSTEPVPDIAETAEFTSPTEFTVTIRPDQKFANGNELSASDVKFSFDRLVGIADPNGPSQLLADLEKVDVKGEDTVIFTLKSANNVLWPQILTSPAGYILDEESFPSDAIAEDADIVEANAFDGPYSIAGYQANEAVTMERNENYDGILGEAKTPNVVFDYYTEATNLKLDIEQGNIDVAYRTLGATAVADLEGKDGIEVHMGPGAEMRFIVFNFNGMPYGQDTKNPDDQKALAVRQAVSDLIDREALAEDIYLGTYQPVYSQVPDGLNGATAPYLDLYGDGSGGPDPDRARNRLKEAGVETPVKLNLQYNTDHYGASSSEEYALLKSQIEESGLFEVNLQSTIWSEYVSDSVAGEYPLYQLGWFSDYPDADNYLNIVYGSDTADSLLGKANESPEVNSLIEQSRVEGDPDARNDLLGEAQKAYAEYIPTIPLLQGQDILIARDNVQGVSDTQDASFRFRVGLLSKQP